MCKTPLCKFVNSVILLKMLMVIASDEIRLLSNHDTAQLEVVVRNKIASSASIVAQQSTSSQA